MGDKENNYDYNQIISSCQPKDPATFYDCGVTSLQIKEWTIPKDGSNKSTRFLSIPPADTPCFNDKTYKPDSIEKTFKITAPTSGRTVDISSSYSGSCTIDDHQRLTNDELVVLEDSLSEKLYPLKSTSSILHSAIEKTDSENKDILHGATIAAGFMGMTSLVDAIRFIFSSPIQYSFTANSCGNPYRETIRTIKTNIEVYPNTKFKLTLKTPSLVASKTYSNKVSARDQSNGCLIMLTVNNHEAFKTDLTRIYNLVKSAEAGIKFITDFFDFVPKVGFVIEGGAKAFYGILEFSAQHKELKNTEHYLWWKGNINFTVFELSISKIGFGVSILGAEATIGGSIIGKVSLVLQKETSKYTAKADQKNLEAGFKIPIKSTIIIFLGINANAYVVKAGANFKSPISLDINANLNTNDIISISIDKNPYVEPISFIVNVQLGFDIWEYKYIFELTTDNKEIPIWDNEDLPINFFKG